MKIAVDVECLDSGSAGIATAVSNLVRELRERHDDLVLMRYDKSDAPRTFTRRARNALRHLWWIAVELPRRLARERVDVLIGPAFYVPPVMPRCTHSIVVVYDLIPTTHPDGQDRMNRLYRNTLGSLCARRADRVVTMSDYTRREVHERLGVPLERITVAAGAASHDWYPAPMPHRYAVEDKWALTSEGYFLFTGASDPRKNVARLLSAHARCVDEDPGFPDLVIAGRTGPAHERCRALAHDLGTSGRVRFTGYVTQRELRALYADALAFVFPSLAEGFGLPVLEAMACGTPVAASDVTSVPEVAGDAALLFDPTDVDAIAHALRQLKRNARLREDLVRRGRQHVRRFSWTDFAQTFLDLAAGLCGEREKAPRRRAA